MGIYVPKAKPLALIEIEEKERRREYIRSAAPTIIAGLRVRHAIAGARVSVDADLETAMSIAADIYDLADKY